MSSNHQRLPAVEAAGSRAPRPAPDAGGQARHTGRRAHPRPALLAALAVGLVAAGLGALVVSEGSGAHGPAQARYGGLPSWLPKTSAPVGRVLTASATHHVLAIQGETVSIDLPSGHVDVTVVGPEVPEEGRAPIPATSPCTFVVTLAAGASAVPVEAAAFRFIDDLGHRREPRLTAMDGGPPPRPIPAGTTASFKLHAVLPTGDGGLTWSPEGGRAIVAWDFSVEID